MAQPLHLTMEGTSSSPMSEWPQPLHLTYSSEWPNTYIWPTRQNCSALISDLLIKMAQHLYLTYSLEWPCTHIWSCENTSHSHIRMAPSPRLSIPSNWPGTSIQRMATTLTFDHVGTNPTVISKWLNTHIWHGRNQSSHHDRMAQALDLTMEGTNPLTMSECLMDSSLPLGGNLDLENTKLLLEVLKIHSS